LTCIIAFEIDEGVEGVNAANFLIRVASLYDKL
jgi:hypothetical protein